MKIQSTAFNLFFPKLQNLRQKFFEFEDRLKGQFQTPFILHPIPDNAPEEIPRISAVSINGHSNLNISLTQLSFQTNYDDRFNRDWRQCKNYIEDRLFSLLGVMRDLVGNEFLFSGLTTEILIDKIDNDIIGHFLEKYVKVTSSQKPFDLNLKLTYVVDEDYYINISLNNVRMYQGTGNPSVLTPAYLEQAGEGLVLLLDINDRYGFNYKRDYRSSSEKVTRILDLTNQVIEQKFAEIVYEGIVRL